MMITILLLLQIMIIKITLINLSIYQAVIALKRCSRNKARTHTPIHPYTSITIIMITNNTR